MYGWHQQGFSSVFEISNVLSFEPLIRLTIYFDSWFISDFFFKLDPMLHISMKKKVSTCEINDIYMLCYNQIIVTKL